MPEPTLPPTPISSTDIAGKNEAVLGQLDSSFALPPAALDAHRFSTGKNTGATLNAGISSRSSKVSSASSSVTQPLSPSLPTNATTGGTSASRRRKASSNHLSDGRAISEGGSASACEDVWRSGLAENKCNLPPPPTRLRKIIQMRPRTAKDTSSISRDSKSISGSGSNDVQHEAATSKGSRAAETIAVLCDSGEGTARLKHGSNARSTSVAGRKSARRTAHSLIERRRRSKMNEEFGVLKSMIPACAGQEMHKLAILQASIEYMRYLQQCITDLQTSKQSRYPSLTNTASRKSSTCSSRVVPSAGSASTKKPRKSCNEANFASNPCESSSPVASSDEEMADACSDPTHRTSCSSLAALNKSSFRAARDEDAGMSPAQGTGEYLSSQAGHLNPEQIHETTGSTLSVGASNSYQPQTALTSPFSLSALASVATSPALLPTVNDNDHRRHFSLDILSFGRSDSSAGALGTITPTTISNDVNNTAAINTSARINQSLALSAIPTCSSSSSTLSAAHVSRSNIHIGNNNVHPNKSQCNIFTLYSPAVTPQTSSGKDHKSAVVEPDVQDESQSGTKTINISQFVRDSHNNNVGSLSKNPVVDDREVTTALLMLNRARHASSIGVGGGGSIGVGGDRGATNECRSGDGGRGMSVRDLLSG